MSQGIVIGIDPGSRFTGYGVIRDISGQQSCIAEGRIVVKGESTAERLFYIYESLQEIIQQYQPEEMAIEQVFFHKNAQSALKLGQARAAAMIAAAANVISVNEYSPKQIKQTAVGYGGADKIQIQQMITLLLKLKKVPSPDAADALAIAICHCQNRRLARKLSSTLPDK